MSDHVLYVGNRTIVRPGHRQIPEGTYTISETEMSDRGLENPGVSAGSPRVVFPIKARSLDLRLWVVVRVISVAKIWLRDSRDMANSHRSRQ